MRTEFYLAWRYFFRGKAKHISFIGVISCLGVMLGVATVIVAMSIINGIDGGLMDRIMKFKEHLIIESADEQQLAQVRCRIQPWPEVENAVITLQTQVFAKFNNSVVPLAVKGFDFTAPGGKDFFWPYVKEEWGEEGFFVGESIRRRFLLNDTIEFYPLDKKPKLQQEKLRGVFRVGLYDIDNYYLIADLEKTKALSSNYLMFLGVKLKDPYAAGQVKEKIMPRLPEGVFVSTWIETNRALFATLKLEKIAMLIILSLIIIIASFNIFATLTVKVVEKTKDIGILKSLGFTNRKILSIFTLQGVILGLIGVAGGTALGLAVCFILQTYPFIRLPEEIFFTEYLPVTVESADITAVAVVSLLIAFVSSIFPARRASRLAVCEALRYE